MMTNLELDTIEREMRSDRQYWGAVGRDRDPWLTRKILVVLAGLSVIAAPMVGDAIEMYCPHCEEPIQVHVTTSYEEGEECRCVDLRLFPDTWRCHECGYENYEGIGYCAICGARR